MTVTMKHLFFDGKLPKFMGFDHGPIQLEGSRATIVQAALFDSHGRESTFCPSWRFICDTTEDWAYTCLSGGVSDRRFRKYYRSDISKWLNFEYKTLSTASK